MRLHRSAAAHRLRRGFSLIELMIVVAIFAILTAIAVGSMREQLPRWKARKAAMEFVQHAETCRALAISYGRECRILMLDYDTAPSTGGAHAGAYRVQLEMVNVDGGWDTLPADSDTDDTDNDKSQGEVDLADKSLASYAKNVSIRDWGSIAGPGSGNTNAIVFDTRGFLSNPSTDFTGGTIDITFFNKASLVERGVDDSYTISIARSGLAKLDAGLRSGDELSNAGIAEGTAYSDGSPFGAP